MYGFRKILPSTVVHSVTGLQLPKPNAASDRDTAHTLFTVSGVWVHCWAAESPSECLIPSASPPQPQATGGETAPSPSASSSSSWYGGQMTPYPQSTSSIRLSASPLAVFASEPFGLLIFVTEDISVIVLRPTLQLYLRTSATAVSETQQEEGEDGALHSHSEHPSSPYSWAVAWEVLLHSPVPVDCNLNPPPSVGVPIGAIGEDGDVCALHVFRGWLHFLNLRLLSLPRARDTLSEFWQLVQLERALLKCVLFCEPLHADRVSNEWSVIPIYEGQLPQISPKSFVVSKRQRALVDVRERWAMEKGTILRRAWRLPERGEDGAVRPPHVVVFAVVQSLPTGNQHRLIYSDKGGLVTHLQELPGPVSHGAAVSLPDGGCGFWFLTEAGQVVESTAPRQGAVDDGDCELARVRVIDVEALLPWRHEAAYVRTPWLSLVGVLPQFRSMNGLHQLVGLGDGMNVFLFDTVQRRCVAWQCSEGPIVAVCGTERQSMLTLSQRGVLRQYQHQMVLHTTATVNLRRHEPQEQQQDVDQDETKQLDQSPPLVSVMTWRGERRYRYASSSPEEKEGGDPAAVLTGTVVFASTASSTRAFLVSSSALIEVDSGELIDANEEQEGTAHCTTTPVVCFEQNESTIAAGPSFGPSPLCSQSCAAQSFVQATPRRIHITSLHKAAQWTLQASLPQRQHDANEPPHDSQNTRGQDEGILLSHVMCSFGWIFATGQGEFYLCPVTRPAVLESDSSGELVVPLHHVRIALPSPVNIADRTEASSIALLDHHHHQHHDHPRADSGENVSASGSTIVSTTVLTVAVSYWTSTTVWLFRMLQTKEKGDGGFQVVSSVAVRFPDIPRSLVLSRPLHDSFSIGSLPSGLRTANSAPHSAPALWVYDVRGNLFVTDWRAVLNTSTGASASSAGDHHHLPLLLHSLAVRDVDSQGGVVVPLSATDTVVVGQDGTCDWLRLVPSLWQQTHQSEEEDREETTEGSVVVRSATHRESSVFPIRSAPQVACHMRLALAAGAAGGRVVSAIAELQTSSSSLGETTLTMIVARGTSLEVLALRSAPGDRSRSIPRLLLHNTTSEYRNVRRTLLPAVQAKDHIAVGICRAANCVVVLSDCPSSAAGGGPGRCGSSVVTALDAQTLIPVDALKLDDMEYSVTILPLSSHREEDASVDSSLRRNRNAFPQTQQPSRHSQKAADVVLLATGYLTLPPPSDPTGGRVLAVCVSPLRIVASHRLVREGAYCAAVMDVPLANGTLMLCVAVATSDTQLMLLRFHGTSFVPLCRVKLASPCCGLSGMFPFLSSSQWMWGTTVYEVVVQEEVVNNTAANGRKGGTGQEGGDATAAAGTVLRTSGPLKVTLVARCSEPLAFPALAVDVAYSTRRFVRSDMNRNVTLTAVEKAEKGATPVVVAGADAADPSSAASPMAVLVAGVRLEGRVVCGSVVLPSEVAAMGALSPFVADLRTYRGLVATAWRNSSEGSVAAATSLPLLQANVKEIEDAVLFAANRHYDSPFVVRSTAPTLLLGLDDGSVVALSGIPGEMSRLLHRLELSLSYLADEAAEKVQHRPTIGTDPFRLCVAPHAATRGLFSSGRRTNSHFDIVDRALVEQYLALPRATQQRLLDGDGRLVGLKEECSDEEAVTVEMVSHLLRCSILLD